MAPTIFEASPKPALVLQLRKDIPNSFFFLRRNFVDNRLSEVC